MVVAVEDVNIQGNFWVLENVNTFLAQFGIYCEQAVLCSNMFQN